MSFTKSKLLYKKAQKLFPAGVNSPVRAFRAVNLEPCYIEKGVGSKLIDADNNQYIDYICGWGSNIVGHSNKKVLEAINNAVMQGIFFGCPHDNEIALAQLIQKKFPMLEQMRFTNSGTEAVQAAIRLARAITKRDKIIKFNGCYHGHADYLLVKAGSGAATFSSPDSAGVPNPFAAETISVDYNDLDALAQAAQNNTNKVAAVVVEAIAGNMGMVIPNQDFLTGIRSICDQHGILLIVDEVMTGFRVAAGGCCELFDLDPDIVILGKVIGGGLPIGCFGACAEYMSYLSPLGPVYQGGTFSGNPLVMAAGIASLQQLETSDSYNHFNNITNLLSEKLRDIANKFKIDFQIENRGAMFGFFFSANKIRNFNDAQKSDRDFFAKFYKQMLLRGVYLAPSCFEAGFINLAHSIEDVEKTATAFSQSLEYLADKKVYPNL